MAITNALPAEPRIPLSETLPDSGIVAPPVSSNPNINKLLDLPALGEFKREMLTWKTPHLGYVQMYINPQQLRIEDRKVISNERTKGGYLIQYAGESLTKISIEGTTGSGGIEGINILRSVYRAEQEAFEGIAVSLEESLANVQLNTLASSLLDQTPLADFNVFQIANDVFRNFGRPQPTLASLAANIEMFFQGELYRGYFESMMVSESAAEPGWFNYSIGFVAFAKQGKRRNFMPWHRQPINPADVNSNPLSFTGAADILNAFQTAPSNTVVPFDPDPLPGNSVAEIRALGRSVSTATDSTGSNVRRQQLANPV